MSATKIDVKPHELCRTHAQKIEFIHKWVISDFKSLFREDAKIKSSRFQIPDYPLTGIMGLTRGGFEWNCSAKVLETLVEFDIDFESDLMPLIISIEISALYCDGTTKCLASCNLRNLKKNDNIKMKFWILDSDHYTERRLIHNDTLTIFCCMTIYHCISTSAYHQLQAPLSEHGLLSHFKTLFNNPDHSDITITVGEKKFHVHKLILIARSSVFAAMFEHNMKEGGDNNVDVTDISEEVMEQLLKFIYTDTIEKLEDMEMELLDAAEKYDIKKLKILCASHLQDNLHIENAAESLVIADRYNVKEVKDYILTFISVNRKKVMQTPGYKAMEGAHPELHREFIEMLLRNLIL